MRVLRLLCTVLLETDESTGGNKFVIIADSVRSSLEGSISEAAESFLVSQNKLFTQRYIFQAFHCPSAGTALFNTALKNSLSVFIVLKFHIPLLRIHPFSHPFISQLRIALRDDIIANNFFCQTSHGTVSRKIVFQVKRILQ